MTTYLVNNSGIHTELDYLLVIYTEISFEQFQERLIEDDDIVSLIGHQTVIDFIDTIVPDKFKLNRITCHYVHGDVCIGLKPRVRLPEVHDFDSSFLSKMYKFYILNCVGLHDELDTY